MVLWYELHVSFDQIINKREETNKRSKSVVLRMVNGRIILPHPAHHYRPC